MWSRLAYTSGGVVVASAKGRHSPIPAGACRIESRSAWDHCTVSWWESGIEQSGQISAKDLSAYLLGCVIQYA
jgi:hypothetical protein